MIGNRLSQQFGLQQFGLQQFGLQQFGSQSVAVRKRQTDCYKQQHEFQDPQSPIPRTQ